MPDAHPRAAGIVRPVPLDVWRSVWEASAEATIFHRPEWLEACCRATGLENVSRLYEAADGARFILPLARPGGSAAKWRNAWSNPVGWGFGGAFGTRAPTADDVAAMLGDVLRESPRLVVNPGPLTGDAWSRVPNATRVRHDAHVVDLGDGFGALWSNVFSSDTRNKVRKAEKRGVEVEWGPAIALLDVFWDVFLRWTRQRAEAGGMPAPVAIAAAKHREPLGRYRAIARHLGDRCQVAVARVEGKAAASALVLLDGDHAHYWRAASDQRLVRRVYANHLVLARTLERAADQGCRCVHLGESGGKRSLVQFKEHFGGRPVSYDEVRLGPPAIMAATRAREHLLRRAEGLAFSAAARLR
jgi:hypothetical protein